tara:strand:- start:15429 stop:16730 length:1302 start_codon:yes stop_codon:yes gene_type:complete
MPAETRRTFRTPPEVISYFDGKVDRPGFSWLDVWAEEHSYAFTVAKAVDAELLGTFRRSISSAIADSKTFDTWRDEIQEELQRLGWWGPRKVGDPTGVDPERLVDFSSRRRLSTIFHSNMRAARAAGQWERIQRTKRALPYLLYVRTAANDPRQEHLGWVGIILPADHSFWSTHFPPNGWGCKCSVRQITRAEAAALLGREPEDGGVFYRDTPPDDGPPRQFRNRRTGEVTEIPAGIDPGWHTNPGLSRARTLMDNASAKIEALAAPGPADAQRVVEELWSDPFLQVAPKLPEKTWLPAGVSPGLEAELGARSPLVSITSDAVADRALRHGMSIDDFAQLPKVLAEGRPMTDPRRPEKDARVLFWRDEKTWWRAIVRHSANGYLRVRSFHQREAKAVAFQILESGGDAAGLVEFGFSEAEAAALHELWLKGKE